MEITVKSVKVVKTGTNKSGAWELIRVTTLDGTEYTTFDKKVKHMGEGAVIDIGEPDIKEGKISFKEIVKVVKEGQAPAVTSGNGKSPEQIAIERCSIEGQTAYNGIIQLIDREAAEKVDIVPADLKTLTFDYARVKMSKSLAKPVAVVKKTEAPAEPSGNGGFKNAGQFLAKCQEVFSLNRSQVLENNEVKALYDAGEFDKAYLKLAELKAGK